MNLGKLLGEGAGAVGNLVSFIEKEVAEGGGLVKESMDVVEDCFKSDEFKAHLAALIDAIKAQ